MIVLVLCVVGFLTVSDYLHTKSNFDREEHLLQVQTEQNVEQAIRSKDALWNTYDASLNEQLRQDLDLVLQEYNRTSGDPSRMDLSAVKKRIGNDIDIYIIDESGVIVYTTYAPNWEWISRPFHPFTRIFQRSATPPDFSRTGLSMSSKVRESSGNLHTSRHLITGMSWKLALVARRLRT